MHKYLVFDLDGTLCNVDKGMNNENINKLKQLEKRGYRIAVCSGKPAFYLCGFLRQVGLDSPIIVGENGSVIQFGVELPPKRLIVHNFSEKAKMQLDNIRQKISQECPHIWFQPNEIAVTPFFREESDFERIGNIVKENADDLSELTVYPQSECYDFIPKNISKASGLELLATSERVGKKDLIAIGDGINDISMLEFADVSIKIGSKLKYSTDLEFENISNCLNYLINNQI